MVFQSVLAVTDFSIAGDRALTRAAMLCAAHGASLRLVHLASPGDAVPHDAACRLAQHARQLSRRHAVTVRGPGRAGLALDQVIDEAGRADLVVWGCAPITGLQAFLAGRPLDVMLRRSRRPVLVVGPSAPRAHANVLVAVDFSGTGSLLARLAAALGPRAAIELFHALDTANEGKLRYAEVSQRAIETYRQDCRRFAQGQLRRLTESAGLSERAPRCALGHGEPAQLIRARLAQGGTDLVVVGKHPASRLSDLLFGSVAGRLLRRPLTDVLVVPHDMELPSAVRGAARLAPGALAWPRVRAGSVPIHARSAPERSGRSLAAADR
ncbi:universal stress protein [Rhizobacter sp. LjRoot28]|jgi:nucleotide-binding universal stress UspA family protein|uniref:universal stress protein n=1 Tax=Rhizobacter sp. LjRoot28 TaxID=3342309 RepID=UPI003ED08319